MMIPGSLHSSTPRSKKAPAVKLLASGLATPRHCCSRTFLGGWLTQTFGWQAVWWINVPLGLIAFIIVQFYSGEPQYESQKLDWFAAVLLAQAIRTILCL